MLPFFPLGRISQVSAIDVRDGLIICFVKWGLPSSIRVDNGKPLGDPQRKSIPVLALWLEGLGINVIFNRPRRPTDNAKVERMQRTTKNWAEVNDCSDIKQLKQRLERACSIQRELYKVTRIGNRTRIQVFPQLYHNARKYGATNFDVSKSYQRLAAWIFTRKTSSIGQFSLYQQVYYLGKAYAKQYVLIKFNKKTCEWNISDTQGVLIRTLAAKNFESTNIWDLTISKKAPKT